MYLLLACKVTEHMLIMFDTHVIYYGEWESFSIIKIHVYVKKGKFRQFRAVVWSL